MSDSRAKIGMAGLASALAFIALSAAAQDRQANPLRTKPSGAVLSLAAPVWDQSPDR